MAGIRPPANDPRIGQIKAGLSGADACIQLLDEAALSASTNKVNTSNPVALAIVKKMHEVHRGFFTVKNFYTAFGVDNTPLLIDMYDPANYFSKILHSNLDIAQLVEGTTYYKALRTNSSRTSAFPTGYFRLQSGTAMYYQQLTFAQYAGGNYTPSVLIQEGRLDGFADASGTINNYVYANMPPNGIPAGNFTSLNINHYAGGGILGTQSFRLANGTKFGTLSDGGIYVQRRLAANVFKDLLCRDLPSLRTEDIAANEVSASSALPYRTSVSCNQCHKSMDSMAANFRNFVGRSSTFLDTKYTFMAPHSSTNSGANSVYPLVAEYAFHQKPPIGKLAFRSYDGTLVSVDTTNVADLGAKIADTNDFYVCMAKKYYQYFTGINANLSDPGLYSVPAGEAAHRTAVINMGTNLKSNQKLKELFRAIFNSNGFKYPGGN